MLLLACDGLWDVMNNHEAVAKMREILSSGVNDMTLVAEKMLDFSLDRGISVYNFCLHETSEIYSLHASRSIAVLIAVVESNLFDL